MRALISIVLAVCLAVGAFAVHRSRERAAIRSVIAQTGKAFESGRTLIPATNGATWPMTNWNATTINEHLHAISTAGCPQTFQTAFFDFVQTQDRNKEPLAGLLPMIELSGAILTKSGELAADALKRGEKMDTLEAWRNVQRAALSYGVGQ